MSDFQWGDEFEELAWLPGGRLNMAHEAIDRHANSRLRDKVALIWEGRSGRRETYTFGQLKRLTNRFANVLMSLGIQRGDRVFTYMERVPELYVAVFGILKVGAIAAPLFSALDPESAKDRLRETGAKVLVTQPELRRRISEHIPELWDLQHIVVVERGDPDSAPLDMADLSYEEEMGKAGSDFDVVPTSQYDHALLHYTSGATAAPRGVLHCHQAVAQHRATGKSVLDLNGDDVYWCTADPGWATGAAYGMLAPWALGVTQLVYEGGFDPAGWYAAIQRHRVTVWYTASSAIEMLMNAGEEFYSRSDVGSLRQVCTVGGPIAKEADAWGSRAFGTPIRNTWWQTETGAILIAHPPGSDAPPGSMGRATPGVEVAILDDDYRVIEPPGVAPGTEGLLAIRPGWPAMFRGYWEDTESYNARFRKGWYITGDRARSDERGYLFFTGRASDERDLG
jgi:acetyl-CoA synthetase